MSGIKRQKLSGKNFGYLGRFQKQEFLDRGHNLSVEDQRVKENLKRAQAEIDKRLAQPSDQLEAQRRAEEAAFEARQRARAGKSFGVNVPEVPVNRGVGPEFGQSRLSRALGARRSEELDE